MTPRREMSVRRVSIVSAMLVALGPISLSLYTPAMPELVRAFQTDHAVVNATLTFYFAGFALSQLASGPIADAFGRRTAAIWFLVLYLAGSVAAALAPTVEVLIAARLIQGIGASVGATVARAVVRDLYPGESGARIMNTIAIILAIGPAASPTIGGLTMAFAGWHAIFVLMVVFGAAVLAAVVFLLSETGDPDPSNVQPRRIAGSYLRLLGNAEFMSASLVTACSVGALYALATMLPFVMIDVVGLTPAQFGLAMLLQSGSFFTGSLAFRASMHWISPRTAVLPGLAAIVSGAALMAILPHVFAPSVTTVMVPVGFYAFGIAFVMPYMLMASLMPFPRIAGSAAALQGFMQMGGGLVAGSIAALIGPPVVAISTIIPLMGFGCLLAFVWYRFAAARGTRGEPVHATPEFSAGTPAE